MDTGDLTDAQRDSLTRLSPHPARNTAVTRAEMARLRASSVLPSMEFSFAGAFAIGVEHYSRGHSRFSEPTNAHTVFPDGVGVAPHARQSADTIARPETISAPR